VCANLVIDFFRGGEKQESSFLSIRSPLHIQNIDIALKIAAQKHLERIALLEYLISVYKLTRPDIIAAPEPRSAEKTGAT
jgi:hypothetical protein